MLCSALPFRKALPIHTTEKTGMRAAQRGLPGTTPQHHVCRCHKVPTHRHGL